MRKVITTILFFKIVIKHYGTREIHDYSKFGQFIFRKFKFLKKIF